MWSDQLYKIYERDKKTFTPSRESFYNEVVHPDSREMVIAKVNEAINNKSRNLDYIHKSFVTHAHGIITAKHGFYIVTIMISK